MMVALHRAQSPTAGLRGNSGALPVVISTLQLLLRAFMSKDIHLIRSRCCSKISVGVRAGKFQLGSRDCSRIC